MSSFRSLRETAANDIRICINKYDKNSTAVANGIAANLRTALADVGSGDYDEAYEQLRDAESTADAILGGDNSVISTARLAAEVLLSPSFFAMTLTGAQDGPGLTVETTSQFGHNPVNALSSDAVVGIAASTAQRASINLAPGTAPVSPVDGDMWYDGANLKIQVGGATKTITIT